MGPTLSLFPIPIPSPILPGPGGVRQMVFCARDSQKVQLLSLAYTRSTHYIIILNSRPNALEKADFWYVRDVSLVPLKSAYDQRLVYRFTLL